jgi:hypothetical protein
MIKLTRNSIYIIKIGARAKTIGGLRMAIAMKQGLVL